MRSGSFQSLLEGHHAKGCEGTELRSMKPCYTPEYGVVVVFLIWCNECGAADFETLSS